MVTSAQVCVPTLTSRIQYAFDIIFTLGLGVSVSFVDRETDFTHHPGVLWVHYHTSPPSNAHISFPNTGFLSEKGIRTFEPKVAQFDNNFQLFPIQNHHNHTFGFDLPAAVFYLLTRYEEYLPFSGDEHNRFPAIQSLAYRYHFLQRPLINEWIRDLRQYLLSQGFLLPPSPLSYRFTPTYDIDLAWAFRERPLWLHIGALTRDALRWNWTSLSDRLAVLSQRKPDPYDTFTWLNQLHHQHHLQPIYFWLIGDRSLWDRNVSPDRPAYQALFRKINHHNLCGIHPSYLSNDKPRQLEKEIKRYQMMAGEPPTKSRQHYLKLQFPKTYRTLMRLGIKHDFSMGFADQPGFRASFSGTFPWYDLQEERITPLQISPFSVMDVTLYKYLKLTPEESLEYLTEWVDLSQQWDIPLLSLWHNSSFYPPMGWKDMEWVYQSFLAKATTT